MESRRGQDSFKKSQKLDRVIGTFKSLSPKVGRNDSCWRNYINYQI